MTHRLDIQLEAMNAPTNQPTPTLSCLLDLVPDLAYDSERRFFARSQGVQIGPRPPFERLASALGGAFEPGLHMMPGAPGTGKTALALQIACECGAPAIFISCELSLIELFRRVIARSTNTFLSRLKSGELEAMSIFELADQVAETLPDLYLADATTAFASPTWITNMVRFVREETKSQDVLVVIDSLHSWSSAASQENAVSEYEAISLGVQSLKERASLLSVPFLVIAERNRATMSSGGLHAGAGSRKIEYSAESVLDLTEEKDAAPDAANEKPVQLKIEKNRHGSKGTTIHLSFNGPLQRFTETGAPAK